MPDLKLFVVYATCILATLVLIACIILTISLVTTIPKPPTLITSTTTSEQEAKAKEIANYRELSTTIQLQRTNIFDFVVVRALLPLFGYLIATVLTFVFGKAAYQLMNAFLAERASKQRAN